MSMDGHTRHMHRARHTRHLRSMAHLMEEHQDQTCGQNLPVILRLRLEALDTLARTQEAVARVVVFQIEDHGHRDVEPNTDLLPY